MDHYLETCKVRGVVPNKPYSGKLMIRVKPEVHAKAAMAAAAVGKSLNAWIAEAIENGTA